MKTFQELDISEAEHVALQKVRDGLASGEYVHVYGGGYEGGNVKGFDMLTTCSDYGCNTVGCIGGWVGREMGLSVSDSADYVNDIDDAEDNGDTPPLFPLYYPQSITYSEVTPKIAANAIDSFLNTGVPVFDMELAA